MNIYEILSSSPNNTHQLNRYHNFIKGCRNANKNLDKSIYTEYHHICPKSLFPEYKDLKKFTWNRIKLTARQHIIAHLILWKCYGGSLTMAAHCMIDNFNSKNNKLLSERKIPSSIIIRYLSKLREEAAKLRGDAVRGKATYKDSEGNIYFLETSDPLIEELSLVGKNNGMSHSEEAKQQMRNTKERVYLYRGLEILYLLTRERRCHSTKTLRRIFF